MSTYVLLAALLSSQRLARVPVLFRAGAAEPALSLVCGESRDRAPQDLQARRHAAPRRHVVHAPRDQGPQLLRKLRLLEQRHQVSRGKGG